MGETTDSDDLVKGIIARQFHVSEVTRDMHLHNDLYADSIDEVELLLTLEDEFNMDIPDEDAQGVTTVGQIMDYMRNKTQPGAGSIRKEI